MPTFSQAQQLSEYSHQQAIATFWQQGEFGDFSSFDNTRLAYALFADKKHTKGIVISSGRTEAYLKYQETAFDLYNQGYDVFLIDHRGQGLSQRLLTNSSKGYVNNFDDYAHDLQLFVDKIVSPQINYAPFLLAHSMGSAIAIRYLQLYDNPIKAAVLSSPMIQFNTGAIPLSVAQPIIASTDWLNQSIASDVWYFLGQSDYQKPEFKDNVLTQSEARFNQSVSYYQHNPHIQLGGATVHWLHQALNARKAIFQDLAKIKQPVLVIQAGADTVVDNHYQNLFCQQLHKINQQACGNNGKPIVVANAKHELFIEQDQYRDQALNAALSFFNQSQ